MWNFVNPNSQTWKFKIQINKCDILGLKGSSSQRKGYEVIQEFDSMPVYHEQWLWSMLLKCIEKQKQNVQGHALKENL